MQDAFTEMLYLCGRADMESNPGMEVCSWHYELDHDCTYACMCMYLFTHVCMYVPMYVCRCACTSGASCLLGLFKISPGNLEFVWAVLGFWSSLDVSRPFS